MVTRPAAPLALLAALLAVDAGCAAQQAPALSFSFDTRREGAWIPQRHQVRPAEKIEGEPAVLTPEAADAGVKGPVSVTCIVSLRGRLYRCRTPEGLPASLQRSIWITLDTWRFRPATFDDVPIAGEHDLQVPLAPAPPGWALPPTSPWALRSSALTRELRSVSGEKDLEPPALIGPPHVPLYTRAAREAHMEGKVIARCVLTEEGQLEDCDIVQSVPYQDQAVLEALAARRYTPARFRGVARRLYFTIPFTFKLM